MRISEIQLETHCLDDLKEFYTVTLELPLIREAKRSFSVEVGRSKLKFVKTSFSENPFYHFAFNIPENQLQEAKNWIKSRVDLIQLHGKDQFQFASWNADAVYFYDPGGNLVEFIARHKLNNRSDEPFSGSSLLSISEIGYAEEDVRLFSRHIQREMGIKLYDGDEKSFAAVGNEEGLFVVSKIGRPWFPTKQLAEAFPVIVDVEDEQKS